MDDRIDNFLESNEQCVFLSCMSCNRMIGSIGYKGKCILRSLSAYNQDTVELEDTKNLLAFTICTDCDKSDNRTYLPMYVQANIEYALRSTSYMIASKLVNGNLDIAIVSGRVAFIPVHKYDKVFEGNNHIRVASPQTVDVVHDQIANVSRSMGDSFYF